MKKGFILFLLASSTYAQAQITLNPADIAQIGKTMILAEDTLLSTSFTPGAGGPNKTWNFSTLQAGYTDTLQFLSPVGQPNASSFPNATVFAAYMGSSEGAYMIKNANGLFIDGIGDPTTAINFNPNEQVTVFPGQYGTNMTTNSSAYSYAFAYSFPPADSLKINHKQTKNTTFDAWGTLVLPSGTYNVLRQRDVIYSQDSYFTHLPIVGYTFAQSILDTTYHYSWWANGQPYPVMQMDSSATSGTYGYIYLKQNPAAVKDINNLSAKLYPNPARNVVHFTTASIKASVSIYDAKGSLVRKMDNLKGDFDLSVSDLNNGMYMYIITGDEDKTAKGSFQVMH